MNYNTMEEFLEQWFKQFYIRRRNGTIERNNTNITFRDINFLSSTINQMSARADRMEHLFWVLLLVANCIALLFNIIGIFAIIHYQKKSNQNIILFVLSLVEIIIALCGVIYRVEDKCYIPNAIMDVFRNAQSVSIFQLVLTMFLLTSDRIICVINPMKYKTRMTRKKVIILVLITWFFSITFGIAGKVEIKAVRDAMEMVLIGIGALYVLLVIITYTLVIIMLKRSRSRFNQNANPENTFKKQFLVPSLIISSFLLLYVVPVMMKALEMRIKHLVPFIEKKVVQFIQVLGLSFDPITYVFLSAHYRQVISGKCLALVRCGKQNDGSVPRRANKDVNQKRVQKDTKNLPQKALDDENQKYIPQKALDHENQENLAEKALEDENQKDLCQKALNDENQGNLAEKALDDENQGDLTKKSFNHKNQGDFPPKALKNENQEDLTQKALENKNQEDLTKKSLDDENHRYLPKGKIDDEYQFDLTQKSFDHINQGDHPQKAQENEKQKDPIQRALTFEKHKDLNQKVIDGKNQGDSTQMLLGNEKQRAIDDENQEDLPQRALPIHNQDDKSNGEQMNECQGHSPDSKLQCENQKDRAQRPVKDTNGNPYQTTIINENQHFSSQNASLITENHGNCLKKIDIDENTEQDILVIKNYENFAQRIIETEGIVHFV